MSSAEIVAKMQDIRNSREAEIQSLDKDSKVIDVMSLVPVNDGEEMVNQKYLLIEEDTLPNGKTVQIELYYDENGNKIGGNREDDNYNYPIPVEGKELSPDLQKELIEFKEQMDLAEKEDSLISLKELEEMKDMILSELELEKIDIDKLNVIDIGDLQLSQEELDNMLEKIEDGDLELEAHKELDDETLEVDDAKIDDPEFKPQKDQLNEKDFSSSATINGNTYINEYDTISSALKVSDEGYEKIAVVKSNQLRDNHSNSKYAFVGIRKDGSAQIIDTNTIKPEMDDMGREDHEVSQTGKVYEDEGNIETFSINGTRYGFGLEDEGGKLEVSLMSTGKGRNGNESVSVSVNSYDITKNEREVQALNRRDPDAIDNGFDEAKQKEPKTVEDLDGNPQTLSNQNWSELVDEIMQDSDVEVQFTSGEVQDMVERYWAEGNTEDEIKYKIETDANNLENARNKDNH